MDEVQKIQENQYDFPYHYIPEWGNSLFEAHKHWPWALRYIGGLKLVSDECLSEDFSALIDVGCGDGRFLREMKRLAPGKSYKGVDYSEASIRYAKAFNPDIDYVCADVEDLKEDHNRYDVLTLIEVVEHIPPEKVEAFLRACRQMVQPGGRIILTVPHANKPLNDKHYRHFREADLEPLMASISSDVNYFYFDKKNRLLRLMLALIGGSGSNFIVTNRWVTNMVRKFYFRYGLRAPTEEQCMRIGCVAWISD
jgi:SAM-dependent methyltransferase